MLGRGKEIHLKLIKYDMHIMCILCITFVIYCTVYSSFLLSHLTSVSPSPLPYTSFSSSTPTVSVLQHPLHVCVYVCFKDAVVVGAGVGLSGVVVLVVAIEQRIPICHV